MAACENSEGGEIYIVCEIVDWPVLWLHGPFFLT